MSTFRNPVGPQPSNVYWRRRLIVGIALLAVVIVVLLIVFSPKGGGSKIDDAKTPAPTKTAPAELGAGTGSGDKSDAKACNPDSISLEAVTDQGEYQTGVQPLLSMKITNLGAAACTLNVGTDAQLYSITSGPDEIWNSKDCQTAPEPTEITLEPGAAASQSTAPFSWDRTRSSTTTCDDPARAEVTAGGGTYRLAVSLGDIEASEDKAFLLY